MSCAYTPIILSYYLTINLGVSVYIDYYMKSKYYSSNAIIYSIKLM